MKFNEFMEAHANEVGAQFQEYDANKSVIIYPLKDGRYQAVLGTMKNGESREKALIEFTSKVCEFTNKINLETLLRENASFCNARFVILDDFIRVEAACFMENATDGILTDILTEVANVADAWEHKLTGQDVH
jgi:hypothetical protein